jgi:hypothetical protein
MKLLVNTIEKLKCKKIIIFTCGLADTNIQKNTDTIYKRLETTIPKHILENVNVFYLRGYIDYSKLSIKHKIMMRLMKSMIVKKGDVNLDDEDKLFLETYGKSIDFMDKNSIQGIVEYSKV